MYSHFVGVFQPAQIILFVMVILAYVAALVVFVTGMDGIRRRPDRRRYPWMVGGGAFGTVLISTIYRAVTTTPKVEPLDLFFVGAIPFLLSVWISAFVKARRLRQNQTMKPAGS